MRRWDKARLAAPTTSPACTAQGPNMLDKLRCGILASALAALALLPSGAAALDKVRLGKAVPNSFAFGATEVGMEARIFDKEGIEIEVTSFRGDAQLQQALP